MRKKKEKYLQFLQWSLNRCQKIERQKRKKKNRKKRSMPKAGIKYTNDAIKIIFPVIIDLYSSKRCEETLNFFNQEYNDIEKYTNGVIFDFSNVKEISLSGGIVLRCFYDFLLSKHTKIKFDGIKRDKVKQILYHIEIFKEEKVIVNQKDISRWTIKHWNRKETTKKKFGNDIISEIIKTTTGWGEQSPMHKRLYEVIPEILVNCIQHAYNDDDNFQLFYLFSGVASNKYVFCVFDRGIGFKATYEKWQKDCFEFNDILNDGDYIKYSIQMDHSSIRKKGRGNGLFTLKENISKLGGAILIYSYKGKVEVSKKRDEIKSENRYPLLGSMVQFEIPIT